MNDIIESLLKYDDSLTDEEFAECDWSKLDVNTGLEPGSWVKIEWTLGKNRVKNLVDYGYVIALPGMDKEAGDIIIHIPFPNGPGKDQEPPMWLHFLQLLRNQRVKKITGKEQNKLPPF